MLGEHQVADIWQPFSPSVPYAERNNHQFPYPLSMRTLEEIHDKHPLLFHPFPDLTETQHGGNPSIGDYTNNVQWHIPPEPGEGPSLLADHLSAAVNRAPENPVPSAAVTRAPTGEISPSLRGDAVMATVRQLTESSSEARTRARLNNERAPYAASTDITDPISTWVPPYEWQNTERPPYTPSFFARPEYNQDPVPPEPQGPLIAPELSSDPNARPLFERLGNSQATIEVVQQTQMLSGVRTGSMNTNAFGYDQSGQGQPQIGTPIVVNDERALEPHVAEFLESIHRTQQANMQMNTYRRNSDERPRTRNNSGPA